MFEALQVGPFFLWTRVIFLLVGIWLFTEFFLRLAQSANLSLQHFKDHWMYYLGAFLVSGRIFAIIGDYRVYLRDPLRVFIVWDGGWSFLGAAIGIGIVLFLVTRGHRSTFLHWLDAMLPAACFGMFFSWLGLFFAGQGYGRPSDLPWAVTYDAFNVRYAVPVHPVQLYYALFYLMLTFVLLVIRKYGKRVGAETLIGVVSASIGTFLLEYFRGDIGIPVFATQLDFIVMALLFGSLGLFALIERNLSERGFLTYEIILGTTVTAYIFLRPFLDLEPYELRFSQLLAILALLGAVVYVLVQRRKFPHL